MARPKVYGIDYFTFNVSFFDDPKILFVHDRFEEKGELIAVKLLCWIYKNDGYYINWNDEMAMLFAKRAFGRNIKYSLVNDVVSELIKREFFNRQMFEKFKILTSSGIQKRWLEATKRRTVEIEKRYYCIQDDTESTVNDTETPPEATETTPEKPEIPQSKVKYSKEKNVYTEQKFLKRWKDARLHYDKKPTNISELKFHSRSKFEKLLKNYNEKEFDKAIQGFFEQDTFPQTRINPDHFLENFDQYLTCGQTGEKLFEKKQKNESKSIPPEDPSRNIPIG